MTLCPAARSTPWHRLAVLAAAVPLAWAGLAAPAGAAVMISQVHGGDGNSGNNSSDFSTAAPAPRNSASPAQPCAGAGGGGGGTPVAASIPAIQGSGATSPMVKQWVITCGVVSKLNNSGFFMQDLVGDRNPATSDAVFVFTGATTYPAVLLGNLVQVTATVVEFNTGSSADTAAHTITQLSSASTITQTGSGYSIAPVLVALPEAARDDLERYEGMLVTLTALFTVNQNFFQSRYGQLTLAVGGRLQTPTKRQRPDGPGLHPGQLHAGQQLPGRQQYQRVWPPARQDRRGHGRTRCRCAGPDGDPEQRQ